MSSIEKRGPWQIWKDVIFALFAREIKTGFNDKFGISWAILNPLLFIFMLSFIRGRMDGGLTHTMPTFVFMAYGMLLIQSFLDGLNKAGSAIKKAKPLFAFRQVQPISAVIASAMFSLMVKTFVIIGIYVAMYFLKMEIRIDEPLDMIWNLVAITVFANSLGLIAAISESFIPELSKVRGLLTRPLFFISGVFFSLQDIPREYWWLFNWNPILNCIELTRQSAYHTYGAEGVSNFYVFACVISSVFFALFYYQGVWKQAVSR